MRLNRIAVATFFFINGFLYGNWTARLPWLLEYYQISNSELGTLLFIMALGAVIAMPFTGLFTARVGNRRLTFLAALLFCLCIPLIAIWPNYITAAAVFFTIGVSSGTLDVSMNGQAVYVERAYARPIMSSFHAVFSIGMAIGSGFGALFTRLQTPLSLHLLLVASVCLAAIIWAYRHLVRPEPVVTENQEGGGLRLPVRAIIPLGIIAFCCMTGEGAMADWSAIYMNKVIGSSEFFSALAVGAFSAAMTTGRIFGDYLTIRLGKYKLLIYSGLLAFSGLALAVVFPTAWTGLLGFFMVGLGLATVVPIVYSSAGNTPGVPPSVGISMATSIGYAGFFVGPPVIGYLSDVFGLQIGLCFVLALFLVMLALVGMAND